MKFLSDAATVLKKDLVVELRTKEIIYTMALFSLLMVVIFSFAFYTDPVKARDYGGGIIWVTILFSATIGLNRLFDRERENNALTGTLLAPVNPKAVFSAKVISHASFVFGMETLTIPLIFLFFDLDVPQTGLFIFSVVLGTIGISLVGVLFSAMLMNARMKEVLLPLVIYPVLVPVIIAGVKSSAMCLQGADPAGIMDWIKLLAAFDMIFVVATLFLFERMIFQ